MVYAGGLIAHHAERNPITKPAASISLTNPRGNGSPTSISIMRVPPNPVCMRTIRAGSSRTSPMTSVSRTISHHNLYETFRSSLSAIQTLIMD